MCKSNESESVSLLCYELVFHHKLADAQFFMVDAQFFMADAKFFGADEQLFRVDAQFLLWDCFDLEIMHFVAAGLLLP